MPLATAQTGEIKGDHWVRRPAATFDIAGECRFVSCKEGSSGRLRCAHVVSPRKHADCLPVCFRAQNQLTPAVLILICGL